MPVQRLPRSSPESQGISSAAILAFVDAADRDIHHLNSLMLLRHGHVLAEGWWSPYAPEIPHMLFSLSKSFASTAVGLAVREGHLSVDDPVLGFFPGDAPAEVSANLAAMRVRHLLSMSTGHAEDTTRYLFEATDGNLTKAFLARPVDFTPGTHFVYNSGATYMLSAIVQKLVGQPLVEYLRPRLFDPLGIANPTWQSSAAGVNMGGWGLNITTEDIAAFGQLYLQKGFWQGEQLVPTAWVAEATTAQVSNAPSDNIDWAQGYGYQFWRCRHNAYRGDGAFGQFCIVMPDQDAVLAITAGVQNMQSVLDLVWEHLLLAFGPDALPDDAVTQAVLNDKLESLAICPQTGHTDSPTAGRVTGKTYRFEPNDQKAETIAFDFGTDTSTVTLCDAQGEHQVTCATTRWTLGMTSFGDGELAEVAASGAWTDDATWVMKLCFYKTPFCPTLTCRFDGDTVTYDFVANVAFDAPARPTLTGHLAA